MIIECPACTTRYDIKAAFPPEGRTVRCAKCGHKWKATPLAFDDEAAEDASAPVSAPREERMLAASAEHRAEAQNAQLPPEINMANGAASPIGFETQPEEAPEPPSLAGSLDFAEPDSDESRGEAVSSVSANSTEKVRWFDGFRRRNEANNKPQEEDAAQNSATTIPFPRSFAAEDREKQQAPYGEELQTLEEARAAVRSVFSSLTDARHGGHSYAAPVIAQRGEARFAESEDGFAAADNMEWQSQEEPSDPSLQYAAFESAERETQEEAEASGAANWNGFDGAAAEEARESGVSPSEAEEDYDGDERESDADARLRETLDRNVSLWRRSEPRFDETADNDINDIQDVNAAVEPNDLLLESDGVFDSRLYRELEETQHHSREASRRKAGGGLALAAAWGLFLCFASGVVAGFFAFRDIVADALPGLAPIYRSIGMPVTVQPLIFEGVQYNWALSGQKPTLIVKGAVYNRAQRKVKVPSFFITIKDRDPQLDREYTARLQTGGSKIKAGERAEFEIELLSPNPTITSLELELRNVR